MEKKQPKRRFKDFQSRGDWEEKKFGSVATLKRGLTYKPKHICDNGIIVLRSSNIDGDTFVLRDDDIHVRKEAVNIDFIKENDILITSANGSTHLVGKHAIIKNISRKNLVHGGFMLVASTKMPFFINALMSSRWYDEFIRKYVAGGNGAIGNLRKSDLENEDVFIPPLEEQEKIGDFFQRLDRLIDLNRSRLDKLRKTKEAYLVELFPREGESYPRRRFPGFTGPWEEKKLGDMAIIKGRLGWKSLKKEEYIQSGPSMIAGKHIRNGVIDWDNVDHIPEWRYYESPEIMLRDGDVIFSKDGTLGNPALIRDLKVLATINSTMMLVRTNETINSLFFYYILLTERFVSLIIMKVSGSSVPHLFQADMNEFKVPIPSLEEQKKIGDFFQRLDGLIAKEEERLDKLENLKKAYLNELFV